MNCNQYEIEVVGLEARDLRLSDEVVVCIVIEVGSTNRRDRRGLVEIGVDLLGRVPYRKGGHEVVSWEKSL